MELAWVLILTIVSVAFGVNLPTFATGNPWNEDISSAPVDPYSLNITTWLDSNGGWGNGGTIQIAPDFVYLTADCSTPRVTVVHTSSSTDCEDVTEFPLPTSGAIEGMTTWSVFER